jgi:hypothetical protein
MKALLWSIAEGHEVGWVDRIADLPSAIGQLLEEELASREFVPEIQQLTEVSSFACPSTWQVVTNRGNAMLILKGEEDIRRLSTESVDDRRQHTVSSF